MLNFPRGSHFAFESVLGPPCPNPLANPPGIIDHHRWSLPATATSLNFIAQGAIICYIRLCPQNFHDGYKFRMDSEIGAILSKPGPVSYETTETWSTAGQSPRKNFVWRVVQVPVYPTRGRFQIELEMPSSTDTMRWVLSWSSQFPWDKTNIYTLIYVRI